MEMYVVERVLVASPHTDSDLFDGASAIVAARAIDRHFRWLGLIGSDEVVLRKPNLLTLVGVGHVIRTVLLQMNRAVVFVARTSRKLDFAAVIEHKLAIYQRTVHREFNRGVSSLNRSQVAGMFPSRWFH